MEKFTFSIKEFSFKLTAENWDGKFVISDAEEKMKKMEK